MVRGQDHPHGRWQIGNWELEANVTFHSVTFQPPKLNITSDIWLQNMCFMIQRGLIFQNPYRWEFQKISNLIEIEGAFTSWSLSNPLMRTIGERSLSLQDSPCIHFLLVLKISPTPGYYDWKDNTLVDYQNWRIADGQPDINWPNDGRGCAFFPPESTDWFDDGCNVMKRYVCKVPLSK